MNFVGAVAMLIPAFVVTLLVIVLPFVYAEVGKILFMLFLLISGPLLYYALRLLRKRKPGWFVERKVRPSEVVGEQPEDLAERMSLVHAGGVVELAPMVDGVRN